MAQGAALVSGSERPLTPEKQLKTLHPGEGAGSEEGRVKGGGRRPRPGMVERLKSEPSLWKPLGSCSPEREGEVEREGEEQGEAPACAGVCVVDWPSSQWRKRTQTHRGQAHHCLEPQG
jgi:hypothetical protein